jgi:phage-related protein
MSRQERINVHKKQGRIDSVKQSFKDDASISVKPIFLLRNDNDGTISNIIDLDKVGDLASTSGGWGYSSEANADKVHAGIDGLVDDVASLVGKVNEILLALKDAGIVK